MLASVGGTLCRFRLAAAEDQKASSARNFSFHKAIVDEAENFGLKSGRKWIEQRRWKFGEIFRGFLKAKKNQKNPKYDQNKMAGEKLLSQTRLPFP